MWSPLLLSCSLLVPQDGPRTVPEATDYARTSTTAEVRTFLESLKGLPHAERVRLIGGRGRTHEGQELLVVMVGAPAPARPDPDLAAGKLRVLINANIHGGEVEGKEALQVLLREIALGGHAELLERASLLVVPVYNADGNDRIAPGNRVSQNGPDGGVGERPNAQGFDLNRDFIKAESPECAALLGLTNAWDPHLFMDLHTTDGSPHAYHLTYAPSLSTSVDPALDGFARGELLPDIRAAMQARHGFRVFDYGNFSGRGERAWTTYDHRPRFGTNYVGLRNRFSILSEAFSYLPLRERIEATHAFVLESLRAAVEHADRMEAICAEADANVLAGRATFGWDTRLVDGEPGEILVGSLSSVELEGLGTRRVAGHEWHPETMRIRTAFVSDEREDLPLGYVLLAPSDLAQATLRRHGLVIEVLGAPAEARVRAFLPTEMRRARRPFQGHNELALSGEWGEEQTVTLPASAWVISARQPLGRVAAQLLEPLSEDSLSTWNVFEDETRATGDEGPGTYPVLRLVAR